MAWEATEWAWTQWKHATTTVKMVGRHIRSPTRRVKVPGLLAD